MIFASCFWILFPCEDLHLLNSYFFDYNLNVFFSNRFLASDRSRRMQSRFGLIKVCIGHQKRAESDNLKDDQRKRPFTVHHIHIKDLAWGCLWVSPL
jgi:hypothetical protein